VFVLNNKIESLFMEFLALSMVSPSKKTACSGLFSGEEGFLDVTSREDILKALQDGLLSVRQSIACAGGLHYKVT